MEAAASTRPIVLKQLHEGQSQRKVDSDKGKSKSRVNEDIVGEPEQENEADVIETPCHKVDHFICAMTRPFKDNEMPHRVEAILDSGSTTHVLPRMIAERSVMNLKETNEIGKGSRGHRVRHYG